jgi:tRNA modification GTPase
MADELFIGAKLEKEQSHTLHYGRIEYPKGVVLDEVIVSLFKSPRSYTGEDVVEISCHGSSYILEKALEAFLSSGARMADPGEYTLRAFVNGKMDLSQAEAVADLIASDSKAAHDVAMQQMRGGFSREIGRLREELIRFASLIELELDFSEEDVEFADRKELKDLVDEIMQVVRGLKDSFALGNVLKKGVKTVIAGRPNAGKSTLLNALLNEERAIVSDIAGTTRDTIEEHINIKGITFRLIDTAGIREAHDTIEAIGVERALSEIKDSSILLYVFDVTELKRADVRSDLKKIGARKEQTLILANKMDKDPWTEPSEYYAKGMISKENLIPLSAINRMNLEFLKEKMHALGLQGKDRTENVVVSNARHYVALGKAAESLMSVRDGLDTGITGDLLAADIRYALNALGEITGEVTHEDLLDHIFSNFCIGK